jgi:hypothetical protein
MKLLTSFTKITTGEGIRVAYTYSEVNVETGEVISQNNKGSFIAMQPTLKQHLQEVDDFISEHYLSE